MCPSPDTMLQVATGGKENDLKIWDGNRPGTPVFQAKNVIINLLEIIKTMLSSMYDIFCFIFLG